MFPPFEVCTVVYLNNHVYLKTVYWLTTRERHGLCQLHQEPLLYYIYYLTES